MNDTNDIPFPSKKDMLDPEVWRMVVHLYSRARLTHSKDKLVASSRVARKFQSVTGDEYVARLKRRGTPAELRKKLSKFANRARNQVDVISSAVVVLGINRPTHYLDSLYEPNYE